MTLQPAMGSSSSDEVKRLIDALRGGTDIDTATLFAGVDPADLTPEVWEAVLKARAEAVVRAVTQIQKAAHQGDWKAAAWWLERALPETYSVKTRERTVMPTEEFECADGHVVTVTKRTDEEFTPVCGICQEVMVRR